MWLQRELRLKARTRGFHLVTKDIEQALPELATIQTGLLHLLLQHTSASLSVNENADPSVRADFETWFNRAVPDGARYFIHQDEVPDDMPAHIKASLLGTELTLPVTQGRLNLGIWQGIYLGEHRDHGGSRRIIATLQGAN